MYDDVPQREIPAGGMGKAYMQELLSFLATAFALCEGAHLHTLATDS